jgi:proteasome lid subunit RPN8/RPN11
MITVDSGAWKVMVAHAESAYPKECCGILLGTVENDVRRAWLALPCRNAYEGDQKDRFQIDPVEQLAADKHARNHNLEVLGFFHSHPDTGAYFSATDLKNSWPWYSNIVMSVMNGRFDHAAAFIANDDQTASAPEELEHPKDRQLWQKS